MKMCKVKMLRTLLNQRLSAAVDEVFVVIERTIAEFEEKLSRTKEENEQQRQLLDSVFKKPQVVLHQYGVRDEAVPTVEQRCFFSVEQPEPDPPHVKDEKEEVWRTQQGKEHQRLELPVIVKSEDDEDKHRSSQLFHSQSESRTFQAGSLFASLSHSDDTSRPPDAEEHSKGDVTCHTGSTHVRSSNCGKTSRDSIIKCHAKEKSFICVVCGKGFYRNDHLISHIRTHTGEKPFICSVCGGRFSQKGSLRKHIRTHTGEKPFSCSMCTKTFSDSSAKMKHLRRHTGEKPFTCSVCNTNFTSRSGLVTHLKVHTGEKPYLCSICGKRFPVKTQLTRHMKIHTGEKMFTCEGCDERFLYNYQLGKHKCGGKKSCRNINESARI